MPKDTVTFELGGTIDIAELENGIKAFRRLVMALTPRNAGVTWIVEDLQAGSATATLRGEADDIAVVSKIVDDYGSVGAILHKGGLPTGWGKTVSNAAEAVKNIADTSQYIRLATADDEFILSQKGDSDNDSGSFVSIGSVTGRIQSLSSRGSLRFNLYDSVFDKAVVCFLSPGEEDRMREIWGQRARVSGRVYREPLGARPVSIRGIINIEILPNVEPGSFRRAKGVVPWKPGDEKAEDTIRRVRDA